MDSAADRPAAHVSPERSILAGFGWGVGAFEEAAALFGCGNRADLEASPDAVAGAGDEAVDEIAQGARDKAEAGGDGRPGLGKLAQEFEDGGGAGKEALGGAPGVEDDEDGAGAVRGSLLVEAVTGQQRGDARRLGGDEAEAVVVVSQEEPADGVGCKGRNGRRR